MLLAQKLQHTDIIYHMHAAADNDKYQGIRNPKSTSSEQHGIYGKALMVRTRARASRIRCMVPWLFGLACKPEKHIVHGSDKALYSATRLKIPKYAH